MRALLLTIAVAAASAASAAAGPAGGPVRVAPDRRPAAIVDLRTVDGAALVGGTWRAAEARLVPADFNAPGPDLKPSGAAIKTLTVEPAAGAAAFDDGAWPVVAPTDLEGRRGSGRVSFLWYRINVTVPERIGTLEATGATLVFEIVLDDYAEIWVDGRLPRVLGQTGGSLVGGFNTPNRVVLTRDARPGQTFQIAVFAANGPLSDPPANYIWVRSATIEAHAPDARATTSTPVTVVKKSPALDALVPAGLEVEQLADGFTFTEGPVWVAEGGYLLFSDPNDNRIYRWSADDGVSVYRTKSGYTGTDIGRYFQPGSNGLAIDKDGRLAIAEHGNRRVTRLERNGVLTVLADRDGARRLNSPNDLVYKSDGTLYFTDPPFGLPKAFDDPKKEVPYSGVYRIAHGRAELLAKELTGPNGLAFSPDERFLYVSNWDTAKKVVMRYPVQADGTLGAGTVFFDMGGAPGEEALDGLKVDQRGNLYVSGPGGLWIIDANGTHLGTLELPELPANFAFGDADGRTLYLTARTGLYRIRLKVPGIGPGLPRTPVATEAAPQDMPELVSLDPRFDRLFPEGTAVERIARGYTWLEGPVWDPSASALFFSDIPANAVHRWTRAGGATPYLAPSGYTGSAPFSGREPGSNGLAVDRDGRLVLAQHGDRRIARLEKDGSFTTLVDRYQGKRLNSPNDVAVTARGDIYFTDPPFGLPGTFGDPARELDFTGVFLLRRGETEPVLLTRELSAPNGLTFSPDGQTLYVSNADPARPIWMAYAVQADGTLGAGRVFADATPWLANGPGFPDGMKTDANGHLYASGPGGLYVFAADGTLLGRVATKKALSNCAFAPDGTLYLTVSDAVFALSLAQNESEK